MNMEMGMEQVAYVSDLVRQKNFYTPRIRPGPSPEGHNGAWILLLRTYTMKALITVAAAD